MTIGLDPALGFGGLVVGASNQLAVSAARAMAESAQPPFNPLVIFGGEGLGKTRLLHAMGHLRLEVEPRGIVRLVSWSELLEGWRAAKAVDRTRDYLASFAECGLLLIDDIQRVLDRAEGRAELLGMLEQRIQARRSMVLASRRAPTELVQADDPAARVIGQGLVVELNPPDPPMRWEILSRRCSEAGVELSQPVLEEIAALPLGSIRDLVGAANRLLAFQAVSPTALDPAQARVLITGVLDEPRPDAGVPAESDSPRPPAEPRVQPPADLDEFGSFLSDVVASVSRQVDEWRERIADAMLRWQGEGYHTARLQAMLDQELATQPEQLLRRFETDVTTLRRLEAEVQELAPDLAAQEAFRDPDQLATALELLAQARVRELAGSRPLPQYRLDDLIEGPSNRLALDAARGAATQAGKGPNPLLIVGESGVGKTHLLHGIGNALHEGGVRGVVCVGVHAFEGSLQESIEIDQLLAWRRRFRHAGALLLDDVQLLAGRPSVQEELSTLVDQLLGAGRQVAFTSAVPVTELSGISPQLLARLASGIVVELPRPDREIRLAMVRRLLAATEAADDVALADYLAGRPADGVRGVHTVVQRVLRSAETGRTPLDLNLARQVLEEAPRTARPSATRAGVLGPTVGGPRLREKLIEIWPQAGDRLIEEFR